VKRLSGDEAVDRPATAEGFGVLGEAAQVFVQRGRVAHVQAEQHLGVDQVHDRLGVARQLGVLLQVGLDADPFPLRPALRLFLSQSRQEGGSTFQIGANEGMGRLRRSQAEGSVRLNLGRQRLDGHPPERSGAAMHVEPDRPAQIDRGPEPDRDSWIDDLVSRCLPSCSIDTLPTSFLCAHKTPTWAGVTTTSMVRHTPTRFSFPEGANTREPARDARATNQPCQAALAVLQGQVDPVPFVQGELAEEARGEVEPPRRSGH